MGGVAIGWLVWVALAGDIAGCSVLQLWVAVVTEDQTKHQKKKK